MTNQNQQTGWQFWVDRGGTFTDLIAIDPRGRWFSQKLLSEDPERYQDCVLAGIRGFFGIGAHDAIPTSKIDSVRMGTTVATNALLEQTGEPTLLLTTQGFADALRIGNQQRPELFALQIQLPPVYYAQVAEATERMGAEGQVIVPLDESQVLHELHAAYQLGLRSVAIAFLHAYHSPQHEIRAGALAKQVGFEQITLSHQSSPLIKFIPRCATAVIDAYLSPVLNRYIHSLKKQLAHVPLLFMQSNGRLADAETFHGKDSILSGPAGGLVGMAAVGKQAGLDRLIGFDMGGTSTDVSHYHGEFEHRFDQVVAGVPLQAPMLRIHTVAAGGGSILQFDQGRYQVGPDSAGANPGPCCYRRGGPLTVTDCNVLLGKIQADFFPNLFGEDGQQAIDTDAVQLAMQTLKQKIQKQSNDTRTTEQIAASFIDIAVANMANAIKRISVQRGYDITEYTLCCFGGAAGQHACLVAEQLGIQTILIHPQASVLSAYGIGMAKLGEMNQKSIEAEYHHLNQAILNDAFEELIHQAKEKLISQGVSSKKIKIKKQLALRYANAETSLLVRVDSGSDPIVVFKKQHQQRFGFNSENTAIVVSYCQIEATSGESPTIHMTSEITESNTSPQLRKVYLNDNWQQVPVYKRDQISFDQRLEGPLLIIEPNSTIVIEPNWQVHRHANRDLIIEKIRSNKIKQISKKCDPVYLEIFNNLFMSIAEQMGTALQQSAQSVNIKERLDFSCAIFDEHGDLIANAPHIPVHLGSMSESIKSVITTHGETLQPGDSYVLNAPYEGGTHLPDITVITPIFLHQLVSNSLDDTNNNKPVFYIGSRGHHADIGGITPGSMPAHSQCIDEEGIVFSPTVLVQNNQFQREAILKQLRQGPYPARDPEQNCTDLIAQVAANQKGLQALQEMVQHYGINTVKAYMQHVKDNATASVRELITRLQSGSMCVAMDNGASIQVTVSIDPHNKTAHFDFSGTSTRQSNNFNAPKAITTAAVLYVLRTLVNKPIPLNSGCLAPIKITLPPDSLLNPKPPAAVVAGNVETSQAICNALFGALGQLAASQGTMNNLTFGNVRYQYYETLCGGTGAGSTFTGASAVHSHMTNTRLTDPEILESRYPVRLVKFSIRPRSGGQGQFSGGDGVFRQLEFLEPLSVSFIANNYSVAPFGLQGGQPGQQGKIYLINAKGKTTPLTSACQFEVCPGDQLVIETPGGGGYGGDN